MRIDGFQNIPALLSSVGADKSTNSSSENDPAGSTSSFSLSSFAEVLQTLQREAAGSAKARSAQVQQLTDQVQSGNFSVDVTKLAAKLIDMQVIDTKG